MTITGESLWSADVVVSKVSVTPLGSRLDLEYFVRDAK